MRLGIISDIHNNVIALETMLEEFAKRQCDGLICAGDIIGIGPYPEETVSRFMKIPNLFACVAGNHERYFAEGIIPVREMSDVEKEHHVWEQAFLSEESGNYLKSLPCETYLNIAGKRLYIAHYAMNGESRYMDISDEASSSDMDRIFSNIDADIVIFGHDHKGFVANGKALYLNPGSLGCPGRNLDKTRGIVLDIGKETTWEQLSITYDVQKVTDDIRLLEYPAMDEILRYFYGIR